MEGATEHDDDADDEDEGTSDGAGSANSDDEDNDARHVAVKEEFVQCWNGARRRCL
jgi:hypothetical protein